MEQIKQNINAETQNNTSESNSPEIMLEVSDLAVSYGNIHAVKGISIKVPRNTIVSLIGSNGAGKSTTLSAISGLVKKKAGTIKFLGQDIGAVKAHKIVSLGLCQVPEGRLVFPRLSVHDNLIMGNVSQKMSKPQMNELIEEQYTLFPRLKERRKQPAGTLSGGEQQMLAVARALMSRPQLLMLDEPSMGLAPMIIDEIFELIIKLKAEGKTILLVEQNASIALSVADYAYVLDLGEISLQGTGEELLSNDEVKKTYLG